MRSRGELVRALKMRGFSKEVIDDVLAELESKGLVDDRAFAGAFARDRVRLAPRGYRTIARELRQRGVSADVIDEVLRAVEAEFPEAEVAARWLERRGGLAAAGDPERTRRRLGGKGFRRETIARITKGTSSPWTR